MNLYLLIIEDEQAIIDDWAEKLEFYSAEEEPIYTIVPSYVKELGQAKSLLSNSSFDAAVIDIRLESADGKPNKDGNELFEMITQSSLTVSAVYTGEPEIVELDEHQKEFTQVFEKGNGDIDGILNWLDEKASMISAIKNMQTNMKCEMAKVFSKSVWPRWTYWLDGKHEQEFAEKALSRHMATHLHASFLNNDELGAHPEEYFFIPPLQDNLDTGDIIFDNGKLEIVVTPRCDMLRSKSDTPTYQLVTLLDKSEDWEKLEDKLKERKETGTPKQIIAARNEIKKFTNHNGETGGHFIQRFRKVVNNEEKTFGPFYAQFNLLRSIERSEENSTELLEKRIASLSNEFVPSLVERLGAYFSRIGTPDYSHPE